MAATGGQLVGEKKSPGPAAYDIRESLKTTISFSFRPKINIGSIISYYYINNCTVDDAQIRKSNPGPGQYEMINGIDVKGKYFISKFHNSGALIIPPTSSR